MNIKLLQTKWHKHCTFSIPMNPNDFLIIYLACGARFWVYYFFDKRNALPRNRLWLKTFLIFLFWIPFALNILVKNKKNPKGIKNEFDEKPFLDFESEDKIFSIQKEFEKILLKSNLKFSIYEFREIAERYIGLTIAKQNAKHTTEVENIESELFKISENKNIKLSSICFYRRNRKRLSFHQKNARQDFLDVLSDIFSATSDKKSLGVLSYRFAALLNDAEAQNALSKMFSDLQQTDKNLSVKNTEKELWKTETHKPLPAKQISIQLQTLTATTNLRRKD